MSSKADGRCQQSGDLGKSCRWSIPKAVRLETQEQVMPWPTSEGFPTAEFPLAQQWSVFCSILTFN